MIPEEEQANYEILRDCLSNAIIQRLSVHEPKERRRVKGHRKSKSKESSSTKVEVDEKGVFGGNDAEELGEFIDYLATEIFTSLPQKLRTISYAAIQKDPKLLEIYPSSPSNSQMEDVISSLPPSVPDSLRTYSLLPSQITLLTFFTPIYSAYISTATAAPPLWKSTRAKSCELCEREHIPLTYHHLIPKAVHAKVLKRGWHEEWELNTVAWLCRACHSYVHSVATNEELARYFYSVELLGEREDVGRFVKWVGGVRWKKR